MELEVFRLQFMQSSRSSLLNSRPWLAQPVLYIRYIIGIRVEEMTKNDDPDHKWPLVVVTHFKNHDHVHVQTSGNISNGIANDDL